jgi:hypothetical protein
MNMKSLSEILSDFDFDEPDNKPVHKNHNQDVDVIDFPCVHRADNEPVNLIWPDIDRGPWIAGGAALRWYQNQPVGENDIDVFCANITQASDVVERIKSYGRYSIKFESENAATLEYWSKDDYNRRWTIQIITRRYFNSLEDVINNFDITVCEVGTAGNEWLLGPFTARDIRERNLRFKMPLQPDAMKRMVKYWAYGYRPVEGTMSAVQNNPIGKWQFTEAEDYQNAF